MEKGLNVTKRVTLEGYVVNRSTLKVCSDTCDVDLYADRTGKGKHVNIGSSTRKPWLTISASS